MNGISKLRHAVADAKIRAKAVGPLACESLQANTASVARNQLRHAPQNVRQQNSPESAELPVPYIVCDNVSIEDRVHKMASA